MNFCPKYICERLQKLGCVSESDFSYADHSNLPHYIMQESFSHLSGLVPAFCVEDFIGPTERARENCRVVFGEKLYCYDCDELVGPPMMIGDSIQVGTGGCSCSRQFENNVPAWDRARHKLTGLPSEAEFWVYIEEAIKEAV